MYFWQLMFFFFYARGALKNTLHLDIGKKELFLLVLGQLSSLPVFHPSVGLQCTHGASTHFKTCKDKL